MIQLNDKDLESLRSQIVTANSTNAWNYKRRSMPYVFTENGIAMLSTVLNSEQAIHVNISIMRTFTKMRQLLSSDESMLERLLELEQDRKKVYKLFQVIFDKLQELEGGIPLIPAKRKKIGLTAKKNGEK